MIIKFDHLTHACERQETDDILNKYFIKGYQEKFKEIGLKNISNKQLFCKYGHQTHDLYYLFCEGKLPIEVVSYDLVCKRSLMELDGKITVFAEDITAVEELLFILGAKTVQGGYTYNIKGIFDKFDIILQIQHREVPDTYYLDSKGLGCITLLVDSLEKIQKKILGTEFICSKIEKLCVNNEDLNIMFVSTPKREVIFELLSK